MVKMLCLVGRRFGNWSSSIYTLRSKTWILCSLGKSAELSNGLLPINLTLPVRKLYSWIRTCKELSSGVTSNYSQSLGKYKVVISSSSKARLRWIRFESFLLSPMVVWYFMDKVSPVRQYLTLNDTISR